MAGDARVRLDGGTDGDRIIGMRPLLALSLLAAAALTGCSGQSTERYLCAGRPDIMAYYGEREVRLVRQDAADVTLPEIAPNVFRSPSISWEISGNRAFLTEGGATLLCRPY